MNRKAVLQNLQANLDWLKKQNGDGPRPESHDRALNLMAGAVRVCNSCSYSVRSWLDRRNRRKLLRRIRETYTRQDGNRALRQLVELAIEVLKAAIWVEQVDIGPLPTPRKSPRLTEAGRANRRIGIAKAQAAKSRQQEKRKALRDARIAQEVF